MTTPTTPSPANPKPGRYGTLPIDKLNEWLEDNGWWGTLHWGSAAAFGFMSFQHKVDEPFVGLFVGGLVGLTIAWVVFCCWWGLCFTVFALLGLASSTGSSSGGDGIDGRPDHWQDSGS